MWKSLKTQDMLRTWDKVGQTTNVLCVFCKKQPDSHDHLFFKCDYSAQVWKSLCSYANLRENVIVWSEVVTMLEPIAKKNTIWSIVGRLVLGAVVYYVWQERNNRVFKRGARNCKQLIQVILIRAVKDQFFASPGKFRGKLSAREMEDF